MTIDLPIFVTFGSYLVAMLAIGFWAYRMTNSLDDYVLGGRSLGPIVTAFSVGASDMSGWLLLGLPGAIYAAGIGQVWIGIGLVGGAYVNWLLVAGRLRQATENAGDAITIPEYLEYRFKDNSGLIRLIAAILTLVFFTFYVGSGLVGGAILFEKVFGLEYRRALLIGTGVIVSYTFIGGFLAVCWTDFVQGCLMLVALVLLPIVALNDLGGISETKALLVELDPGILSPLSGMTFFGLASLLAWGLGYFGQPHILVRFMAISSPSAVPTARRVAMGWMLVALVGATTVGLVGRAFYADAPLDNPETVFILLNKALLNPWVAGVLIAAIMSAIMSTIDSQLLVCSSAITEDLAKCGLKLKLSEKAYVWLGRASVGIVAVVALMLALDRDSQVLQLVSYAWAGFGCAFGPVIILSLYWKGISRIGAIASMLTGAFIVVIWPLLFDWITPTPDGFLANILGLYEMIPGFILSSIVAVFVSKVTPDTDSSVRYEEITG